MDDNPGDTPEENPDGPEKGGQNPFKGTPFEQLFGSGGLAGGLGGMQGLGGMPDLGQLFNQIQSLMQPHEGTINWDFAVDMARKTAAQSPDPSATQKEQDAVAGAIRLADHWLDETTTSPSGVTSTAAWSRAEWIVGTADVWKVLVEPIADGSVQALGNVLPEEARAMSGPLLGILGKAVGAMLASQVGSGLGALASEVLSVSDIGLPLASAGKAALVPANVEAFAAGLDVTADDVFLYLALREAAHQRLFAHVPWLRAHLLASVEDYGRGTSIDVSKIESPMADTDPMNPASLQEALEGGLFEPEKTTAQTAALTRLETTLALVEGWVDAVVGQATESRMPSASKMQEAVRRRRAAGGPAESTFAALVGLELRPRRLRDASALWGSLRSRQGHQGRDAVWAHPDLLPTSTDLDDPLGFRERTGEPEALTDAEFDAALADLLDNEPDE